MPLDVPRRIFRQLCLGGIKRPPDSRKNWGRGTVPAEDASVLFISGSRGASISGDNFCGRRPSRTDGFRWSGGRPKSPDSASAPVVRWCVPFPPPWVSSSSP